MMRLVLLPLLLQAGSATDPTPETWPLQVKQQMGEPRPPARLPVSRAPNDTGPRVATGVPATAPLTATGPGRWTVGGWRMAAAPEVAGDGAAASRVGYRARGWRPAVVPGTALTTLVANGVHPDPSFGLNNLRVPETLARRDYWYRTEIAPPADPARRYALVLDGANYRAEVWVDGVRLGEVVGAFRRGRFQLPAGLADGRPHAVAIRVSPPPHPGFPHEQSLLAGPGNNGGALTVDGPTFVAAEGWDWIPGVRDRNTGLWQAVRLEATGPVRVGDVRTATVLPRGDGGPAELTLTVPVVNEGTSPQAAEVRAAFDGVVVAKRATLPPGETLLRFVPAEFPALRIAHPKLWWPNGYGEPALHDLAVTASVDGGASDTRRLRFGLREVSYELSLADRGRVSRVEYRPALGGGAPAVDVRHEAIVKQPNGWTPTLADPRSPAVRRVADTPLAPNLLLKVNGVPIAVRGGNWGMDDWMKRVGRDRLEPFFRLHRDAHLNTIRNWVGQSTEPAFFDLADEYGLLVLNDFWISTQDWNGEPGDAALFLDNAADVIARYQHHPSVALWMGRNEGVPPPVINEGLDRLARELDGTRHYQPNSRLVNMADSGPWDYQPPERYFDKLAQGFSTEVGVPSFPTREAFEAFTAPPDRWPVGDAWAYHDWHQAAGGDVKPFTAAMTARLGAPASLADFERKAQVLNYEAHRAIFEGMNAGLFTRNSGRLLWMTQPAWPSTNWQMMSSDYDTHASFYGVKKGSEPVHVQLAADTGAVQVVNSLPAALCGAVRMRVVAPDGRTLADRRFPAAAPGLRTVEVARPAPPSAPLAFVRLSLEDARGRTLSDNFYWRARGPDAMRGGMNALARVRPDVAAAATPDGRVRVTIRNGTATPLLMAKLTLLDGAGARVLPAFYGDNYLSLLPGEARTIEVACRGPCASARGLGVRGWNVEEMKVAITPAGAMR